MISARLDEVIHHVVWNQSFLKSLHNLYITSVQRRTCWVLLRGECSGLVIVAQRSGVAQMVWKLLEEDLVLTERCCYHIKSLTMFCHQTRSKFLRTLLFFFSIQIPISFTLHQGGSFSGQRSHYFIEAVLRHTNSRFSLKISLND